MQHTDRMHVLDRAAIPHSRPGVYQASVTEVEETKALLGLGPIFLCVCIWQVRALRVYACGWLGAHCTVY